ncbi:hypothetical protein GYMLUDRAFT_248560 [Collybiopsis luxurians FD-317 M1]|uniref:Unplaced genomic scaffold GYMLUscaffold_57, whole genome shotgun sequence n=1 Tax=Collybiopsis luxurians FD-317 M1 TaxID=944289 RepID=A0A0D0BZX5_9AGAR|nr:hypothetical protein GYMLUDRAFT_248560 [Collybiopsis luxurians FD-317 M1]
MTFFENVSVAPTGATRPVLLLLYSATIVMEASQGYGMAHPASSPGLVLIAMYLLHKKLNAIPTVGPTDFLSASRFWTEQGWDILQEGYNKYPNGIFKVALPDQWMIIINGRRLIEDTRKASEEELNMTESLNDALAVHYTLTKEIALDPYHVAIIRTPLTRNIAAGFGEIKEEMELAFTEYLADVKNDWVKIPAYKISFQIVGRVTNRYFVGLPLCRDSDWLDLNTHFAIDVFMSAAIINMFPQILKPLAGRFLTKMPASMKRATKLLQPIIQDRLAREEEHGGKAWPGKPNDLISWLIDEAKGGLRNIHQIIARVLAIEAAAINTTSTTLCNSLYQLATASPSIVQMLREEVDEIIAEYGWSKQGISKMCKLDSFLRETSRFSGAGGFVNRRKVMKDFTFSNGVTVPAGTTLCTAAYMHHHDKVSYYENPDTFDPLRFYRMREHEGANLRYQMFATDLDFLMFGSGRNSCPGRFFAVYQIKALIAHVLTTFDIKFENGVAPAYKWYGPEKGLDTKAVMMFRKRQD